MIEPFLFYSTFNLPVYFALYVFSASNLSTHQILGSRIQLFLRVIDTQPDQMFHILAQACLTEKQLKFYFNRKTIVFVLCLNPSSFYWRIFQATKMWNIWSGRYKTTRPKLSQISSLKIHRSASFVCLTWGWKIAKGSDGVRRVVKQLMQFEDNYPTGLFTISEHCYQEIGGSYVAEKIRATDCDVSRLIKKSVGQDPFTGFILFPGTLRFPKIFFIKKSSGKI